MNGEEMLSFTSNTTVSSAYRLQFDQLKQHATYAGTEMIDGTQCHVLQVDDPSKVNAEMRTEAERTTYYVHADRLTPGRVVVTSDPSAQSSPQPPSVPVDLESYATTDGPTLPHRMEIHLDANISVEQRRKMNQMTKSLESPPEQKRKQIENTMGGQMEMMEQITAGEPITIDVQSVEVNAEIPEGVFE